MTDDERAYFADKIKFSAKFYEEKSKLIDSRLLDQVERLAKRASPDELVRQYIRDTMNPNYIVSRVLKVLSLLESSELVLADQELERLRMAIEYVDVRLKQPIFKIGLIMDDSLEQRRNEANTKRKTDAEIYHRDWTTKAIEIWKNNGRLSANACAQIVISTLGLEKSQSTVRRVIAVVKPKKVGKAG